MPYQLSVPAHATVLRAARAMYPHDGLPDEAYEKVVRKLEADAAADGGIAATIDEGVAALGDGEIDEALLRKHADDPFVALLQSTAVVELYDNPLVWNAFGYEGPSTEERLHANAYRMDRERLAGLRGACEAAGVAWKDVAVHEAANQRGAGAVAARAMLDRAPRPTAIAALTDQLALGVLDTAHELGIAVPGELSVTGFDDIVEAARCDPPLTTVRQPLGEKGDVAGRVLLDLIAGKRVRKRTLPIELKVRASTGPPPGRG